MEAYLNELSLTTYTEKEKLKKDLLSLGHSLRWLSEWQITAIRVKPDFHMHQFMYNYQAAHLWGDKDIFPDPPKSLQEKQAKEETEEEIDYDLKHLLLNALGVLEPVDTITSKHNITSMTINGNDCFGLGLAAELVMNTVALSFPGTGWDEKEYSVSITSLDDDAEEITADTVSRNICSETQCELHRSFLAERASMNVRSGNELWVRRQELFPNLSFCSRVKSQLRSIKGGSEELGPIISRLFELQRVASQKKTPVARTDFGFRTTPDSPGREQQLSNKLSFVCPDDVSRLFSWHSRYTPGAGRIHFYQVEGQNLFYIGYIGEKIE